MAAGKVLFVPEPPVIEISSGIGRVRYRSGEVSFHRTVSIKTLQIMYERIGRALDRHANGDENIIIDD